MNTKLGQVLTALGATATLALGVYSKLKGMPNADTLVLAGMGALGTLSVVHKYLDQAVAKKNTVEGVVDFAQKLLDTVAPQYKKYVDPAATTIDQVLESLAKAEQISAATAAGAAAGATATPSAAPGSPIAQ